MPWVSGKFPTPPHNGDWKLAFSKYSFILISIYRHGSVVLFYL